MGNKKLIKRSIFKEKISELKSKKFSFEINRIELPNGHEGEYGYIKHPGAALAVPITKNNKVIILRQYRFAVSRYLLEFPAGTLEIGETPISSIQREIQEETGFSANKWDELGTLVPAPGYADEEIYLFLGFVNQLIEHFGSSNFVIFWLLLKISDSGVITKFRFMNLG